MSTSLKHGTGDYTYWHGTLQGKKLAMHDGEMHAGFYRMKNNKHVDDAVSYFFHGSDLVCLVNGKTQPHGGADVWTRCGHYAVSHEDYQHRIEKGRWPNDAEIVAKSNNPQTTIRWKGLLRGWRISSEKRSSSSKPVPRKIKPPPTVRRMSPTQSPRLRKR